MNQGYKTEISLPGSGTGCGQTPTQISALTKLLAQKQESVNEHEAQIYHVKYDRGGFSHTYAW